jgi:DNA-binding transcriptional LysR family regulator
MGGDLRQEIGALGPRRRQWAAGRSRDLRAHRRGCGVRPVVSSRPQGSRAAPFWIAAYLQRYGEASIDADFTSRVVDLVHEGFDLALRVGELADSSLAARRLGELTYGLYGPTVTSPGAGRRSRSARSTATRSSCLPAACSAPAGGWPMRTARR